MKGPALVCAKGKSEFKMMPAKKEKSSAETGQLL